MQPTDEQALICEAVATSANHVMIDALAGTGKTSTLAMAAQRVRGFGLALAFNKKNAEDLRAKLPPSFESKTMNSLGYGAMRRALPQVKSWKVDGRKTWSLLTEANKAAGRKPKGDHNSNVVDLVRAAQLCGLRPGSASGLTADTPDEWQALADNLWLDEREAPQVIEQARSLLIESNQQVERGFVSFDDQVYWPLVHDAKFDRAEMVFGDEAQDWNLLQHELVARVARGRIVAAGDPRQSIYAFRGARTDSMAALRAGFTQRQWTELGLTMTWRCPKAVVQRQLWHVPHYRAAEGAPEGRVQSLGAVGKPWGISDLLDLRANSMSSVAVLCRNNAPLFRMAFSLLRQRVSVVMQGTDLCKQLLQISKKVEPQDGASTEVFARKLDEWVSKERARAKDNDSRLEGIEDRAECLRAVAEATQTTGELRQQLEALFTRTTGTILLSTIHRAKGLEWDVVLLLDSWRMPSKQALKAGGEALQQEYNLQYVAETRTKQTLALADLETFR